MEKEIIGTLFVLFAAFSVIIFGDLGTGASLFLGGMSTLLAMLQLASMEGEVE